MKDFTPKDMANLRKKNDKVLENTTVNGRETKTSETVRKPYVRKPHLMVKPFRNDDGMRELLKAVAEKNRKRK